MENQAEPISMTVYPEADGTWWIRLSYDSGEVENMGPIAWKDQGDFYTRGLDFVVSRIPKGYVYQGAASWQKMADGSYMAILHRKDPRFG